VLVSQVMEHCSVKTKPIRFTITVTSCAADGTPVENCLDLRPYDRISWRCANDTEEDEETEWFAEFYRPGDLDNVPSLTLDMDSAQKTALIQQWVVLRENMVYAETPEYPQRPMKLVLPENTEP